MTLTLIGSFALAEVTWNGMRAGLLAMDLLCFVGLWLLAERAGRWWLVLAAGFQLIGLLGHLAPFLAQERLAWALITLLWGVWTLVSITVFFGVWEVLADRRFAREERDGATMDHGGGARCCISGIGARSRGGSRGRAVGRSRRGGGLAFGSSRSRSQRPSVFWT